MKNKKTNLKSLLFIIVCLLIVVGLVLYFTSKKLSYRQTVNQDTSQTKDQANYSPPTEEEKKAGDDVKQNIVNMENKQNNTQMGLKQVMPVITSASLDNVLAYIPGVFEEGGTCIASFIQNSTVITRTSIGFGNVSYTQCAPINPNLPNGNKWLVAVEYKSKTSQGKSKSMEIQ